MTSREARARLAAHGAAAARTHLVSGGSVGPANDVKVCSELLYHVHTQASVRLGLVQSQATPPVLTAIQKPGLM